MDKLTAETVTDNQIQQLKAEALAAGDDEMAAKQVAILGTMSDPDAAEQLGTTAYAVRAERERRGIPPARAGRKPPLCGARSVAVTVWCAPSEVAMIDAARGPQSRADFVRGAALAKATPAP